MLIRTDCTARMQMIRSLIVYVQVAVALMQKMQNPGSDASASAERFAKALHDAWGVGHQACNNGVLLFLAVQDRQIYISTGKGAKEALDYDSLGNIINDVKPLLKAARYDDAIERAVTDIGLALAGKNVRPKRQGWTTDDFIGLFIFGGFFAFIGLSIYQNHKQTRRYSDCKSKLDKLRRDQAAVRANAYNATSCPVCLEDFAEEVTSPKAAASTPSAAAASAAAPSVSMACCLRYAHAEDVLCAYRRTFIRACRFGSATWLPATYVYAPASKVTMPMCIMITSSYVLYVLLHVR